ncbi:hypothetical protein L1987_44025 [Smallanthus sonchifolius]|uniref:Uncharacterized protein n=1 Tax=Smallanthus sonchifolius TaxID=185202 RepID=A0ACB9GQC0_9ASTR|nr:hypothetical protein L1987_44025 [Smallanthus sonchifolius]
MSDGGSSNEIESRLKKRRRKNDEFAHAIARIAVAQVCESVGFHGFQQSALDTLSDVACKYVCEIGKASSLYANLAGRTECNVFDIVQGLEDLNLSQGFIGASDRDSCFSGSGIIKDISQYVNLSEEIGFAYSVPSFPVTNERKSTPSFLQAGETPPTDVIPPWLPKFPDPQTYTSIPSSVTEETQILPDKIDQEQKVLEPPSSKLKQFQSHSESVFPVILEQGDVSGSGRLDNPFLVVPLQPGEKEISVISLPAKLQEEDVLQNYSNHVSELDTCAPENQEVKSGGNATVEGSRKVVLNNRPAVEVKFQTSKKSLDIAKAASWFLNDEEEKRTKKVSREAIMDIEDHKGNDSGVN